MGKRRLLALVAAALLLASLPLPYWTALMKAPTYPENALTLDIYSYKYGGEIKEWGLVGKGVGIRVPPPIPNLFFQLFPAAIVGLAALAVVSALKDRWLLVAALLPWVVLISVTAWGQYSLYLFGHDLDPERPLKYLEPFTAPIIGIVTMGKIQVYHLPNLGALLFLAAALLLVANAISVGTLRFPRRKARQNLTSAAAQST